MYNNNKGEEQKNDNKDNTRRDAGQGRGGRRQHALERDTDTGRDTGAQTRAETPGHDKMDICNERHGEHGVKGVKGSAHRTMTRTALAEDATGGGGGICRRPRWE